MLVEDDPSIRALLVELLSEETSSDVLTAATGREALKIAERCRPDLLILDYLLEEGMTGLVVYDQLHACEGWKQVPTLLVTATPPIREAKARQLPYLQKPFDLSVFLTTVEEALRQDKPSGCARERGGDTSREKR